MRRRSGKREKTASRCFFAPPSEPEPSFEKGSALKAPKPDAFKGKKGKAAPTSSPSPQEKSGVLEGTLRVLHQTVKEVSKNIKRWFLRKG